MENIPPPVPPPMNQPPQVTKADQAVGLWLVSLLVFASLIGLANFRPPESKERKEKVSFRSDAMQIKSTYSTRALFKQLGVPLGSEKDQEKANADLKEQMQSTLKKVRPHFKVSPSAAALGLFIGEELGFPPDMDALNTLKKSDDPHFSRIAEVYEGAKLSPAEGEALFKELNQGSAEGKLAAFEALKRSGVKDPESRAFPPSSSALLLIAGAVIVGGLALGILAWAVYFLIAPKLPKPEHPIQTVNKGQHAALALLCSGGLVIYFIITGFASAASNSDSIADPIVVGASLLFVVAVMVFLSKLKWNDTTLLRSLHRPMFKPSQLLLWGVGGFVANIPVLAILLAISMPLIQRLSPEHPASEAIMEGSTPMQLALLWILAGVVAPIWEETAFRGFLLKGLSGIMKPAFAVLLTAFSFAAIHPQGPALWLVLGWVGAMGCFLTLRTRSIVPAIIMHCLHNTMTLLIGIAFS